MRSVNAMTTAAGTLKIGWPVCGLRVDLAAPGNYTVEPDGGLGITRTLRSGVAYPIGPVKRYVTLASLPFSTLVLVTVAETDEEAQALK